MKKIHDRIEILNIDNGLRQVTSDPSSSMSKNNKHRLNQMTIGHRFDPANTCFEICDNRTCQISRQCLKIVDATKELPNLASQIPVLDTHNLNNCRFDEDEQISTSQTSRIIKYLKHSIITSLMIHSLIAAAMVFVVYLLNPTSTSPSDQSMVTLDVVMIDTNTMNVLEPNKIAVNLEVYKSIQPSPSLPINSITPEVPIFNEANHTVKNELNQSQQNSHSADGKISKPEITQSLSSSLPKIEDISNSSNKIISSNKITIEKSDPASQALSVEKKIAQELTHSSAIKVKNRNSDDMTDLKANEKKIKATNNNSNARSQIKQLKNNRDADKSLNKNPQKKQVKAQQINKIETESNSLSKPLVNNKSSDKRPKKPNDNESLHSIDENNDINYNALNKQSNQTTIANKNIIDQVSTSSFAKPIKRINPAYPTRAANLGITGKVVVRFDVNSNGKLENIEIIESSHPREFDKEVKRALKNWVYEKKTTKGIQVTFNFKLDSVSFN